MLDIPPEVSVALDVVKALNASGRCREDAALYGSASGLVKEYLDSAARSPVMAANEYQSAPPATVAMTPGPPPHRVAGRWFEST